MAAVVHEINNPLMAIQGGMELVARDLAGLKQRLPEVVQAPGTAPLMDLTGKLETNLLRISSGCENLTRIVRDLKGFGKRGTDRAEIFALELPVRDALGIMSQQLKTLETLEVEVPPELKIFGHRLQISQVFINLIHNAVDVLGGQGGKISIRAEADHRQQVVIEFKDSGPGVPENLLDRIFDPFFTTKGEWEGTGLGLFIVRQILDQHQGTIQTIPHKGPGAWFRLTLLSAPEVPSPSSRQYNPFS